MFVKKILVFHKDVEMRNFVIFVKFSPIKSIKLKHGIQMNCKHLF
jgi:hypothetical protein